MKRFFLSFAGISGMLAVVLGAMGAHALKTKITAEQLMSYETAVKYQMYHTLALLILVLLSDKLSGKWLKYIGICFMIGIVFFSGSIYLLATKTLLGIKNWYFLGPVTPLGGMFFIAGWALLSIAAFNEAKNLKQ